MLNQLKQLPKMSKLKTAFFLFLITSFYSFSQNDKNDSTFIYIDKDTKHIESSFRKDSSGVSFCIYLKEFETKTLRKAAQKKYAKKQKELYPLPPIRKPLEFCIVGTSVNGPTVLHSINSIKHITPDEFRNGNHYSQYIYVIYKIKDGYYLKWRIFIGI